MTVLSRVVRASTLPVLIAVLSFAAACAPAAPSPTPASSKPAAPAASPAAAPAASPAAAVASPAAAVASPAASPVAAAKPSVPGKVESVKVAHAPSTLFAPLYVAIEKGYLKDQAIDVQLDTVPAGQDAMALVAAGQLDAVVAGFGAATFAAVDRGLELKVTGSMGVQPQQGYPSAFMVRKDLLQS